MARMVRLLRAMPELMILMKGIFVAARSVFFTLCLLLIVIYIFAITFRMLCADTALEDQYFQSVPAAMNTLLLKATFPDHFEIVDVVGSESPIYAVIILIFILISGLTVLNMLVGVLCEVVSVVSSVEKEQMTVMFVKTKLLSLLEDSGVDDDGNKLLSKQEFGDLLMMPEGARIIQEVGVDVVGLVDFADHIFKDGKELTFPDFMELVLQLRGSNNATVRDIVDLRKAITLSQNDVLEASVAKLIEVVGEPLRKLSLQWQQPLQDDDCYNSLSEPLPGLWPAVSEPILRPGTQGSIVMVPPRDLPDTFLQDRRPPSRALQPLLVNEPVTVMDISETPDSPQGNYVLQVHPGRPKSAGQVRFEDDVAESSSDVQYGQVSFGTPEQEQALQDSSHSAKQKQPYAESRSRRPLSAQARVFVPPHAGSQQALPAFPAHMLTAEFQDQDTEVTDCT